jgi:hypothetical protein
LYAGGTEMGAGGVAVNHIARWNGTVWDSVGSGMQSDVSALTAYNGYLYEGGGLYYTNGNYEWIARWASPVGIQENHNSAELAVYPNPFNTKATIEIKGTGNKNYELQLFNILGDEVFKSEMRDGKAEIAREDLSPGVYVIKIISNHEIITAKKIVIQ